MIAWLRSLFNRAPREPKYGDFIHYSRNGTVTVDWAGWLKTPQGQADWKAQREKMDKFEARCRARSPDGSFSFHDSQLTLASNATL